MKYLILLLSFLVFAATPETVICQDGGDTISTLEQGNDVTVESYSTDTEITKEPTIKELIREVRSLVKNKPDKGSPLSEWTNWIILLIALIGSAIGAIVGVRTVANRSKTKDST